MRSIGVKSILLAAILLTALNACTTAQPATPTAIPTSTPVPPPVLLGKYPLLSPEDMRHDLDEIFKEIEANHPDPYSKRSRADVDLDRQRLSEELGRPMNVIDFYKKVGPLVASLGDDHTFVSFSDEVWNEIDGKERYFPLEAQFEGGRAFLIANYSGDAKIPLGAEILTIDGTPLSSIQAELLPGTHLPFSLQLWLLRGSVTQYQVELRPAGAATPVSFTVPGLTLAEIEKNDPVAETWEPLTYTKLPGEKIGILHVNSFVEMSGQLQPTFARIQADGIDHLIVDVRANRGGYYDSVARLMDYLTDQPYSTCSRKYKAPIAGYGSGEPREYKCARAVPFDAPERFRGKLYVLIGPDTLSAAVTFASIMQDFQLATLVGEETTAPASYCADIAIGGILLPRTKLKYMYPRTCFVRPSGVRDDQGVIPDILVPTTIQDRAAGQDPVLDYTLEMIRNGDQRP